MKLITMIPLKFQMSFLLITIFFVNLYATPFSIKADSIVNEIEIWPGAGPGSETLSINENITVRTTVGTCSQDRTINNVTKPSITPLIPENPNGAAVIICPGGAYKYLVYDVEGMDVGHWLNSIGITAFVLKYRLPSDPHDDKKNVPLQDAQRALRYVRTHAETWGLDTTKIGIMGASAGGHLASTLAHAFNKKVYEAKDSIDNASARPDFMLLLYPVVSMENSITHSTTKSLLLGSSPSQELIDEFSAEKNVSSSFPPTYMTRAADDTGVSAENCNRLYNALQDSNIQCELKIFDNGGHGTGICKTVGTDFEKWPSDCTKWLHSIGMTENSQSHKVRIATVGNSITYGALLSRPAIESYPAQLNNMLAELYGDTVEVSNFSVSGRTMMRSAEDPIWVESQFSRALKFVPDICLILLGTNDTKPYRWESWGNEFLGDYQAMIDTFKYRNPNTKFIVCYPPPIWDGHTYGNTYATRHNDTVLVNKVLPAIDTIVQNNDAILIDFHTPFIDSVQLFPDFLHPSAQGSKIMAEIVYNKIIETDLIHQIETGFAFVSSFDQYPALVPEGNNVELKWTSIFADSVFLDGLEVNASGNIMVSAEEGKTYTLTAKGTNNDSEYQLHINTYVPQKSRLNITLSSTDYVKGDSITLFVNYFDQYNNVMPVENSNITWSITEGEGILKHQTDSSIVFIPVAKGKLIIEAKEGEISTFKVLRVNSLKTALNSLNINNVKVFPNPANNKISFQIKETPYRDFQIRIFNLQGEQIIKQNFSASENETQNFDLNISTLNQGVYIYAIYFNDNIKYGQFVKQK